MSARLQTRTPETLGTAPPIAGDGVYAWTINGNGDLVPSGATGLSAGQAWEYNGNGDLVPTGAAITDDPYWEYNGNGDLVPKSP